MTCIRLLTAFVFALVSAPCFADICHIDMSFADCLEAIEDEQARSQPAEQAATAAVEAAKREARAEVASELATINTGSQSGSDTATDDFNPRLQASVDTLGASADQAGAITLSWNDLLRDWLKSRFFGTDGTAQSIGQHHKLIVKLEDPELFEPLKVAIADPAVSSALENELDDFDDVVLDFRLSPTSRKYGRDLQQHGALIDALQLDAFSRLGTDQSQLVLLQDEALKILQESGSTADELDETKPIRELFPTLAAAQRFVTATEAALNAHLHYVSRFADEIKTSGFYDLVELVNNQPQLVFAVQGRVRDDLVGPDEYSAKFSYELGGINLNRYRRYSEAMRASPALETAGANRCESESSCLRSFLALNDAAARQGNRLAFSLEYVQKSSYDVIVNSTTLELESEQSLIGSLVYSQYFNAGLNRVGVSGRTRIDLTASYEDVSDDPARQDRAIANLTLSQEIARGFFLTVGAVWASKPEFRGEVDKEISARAGISYKLARQE